MRKSSAFGCALLVITLAGCAAKPRSYDSGSSRALNLARAGGIYDMDLRDSPNGTRSYSRSLLMTTLNLASLATSIDAPLRHLSGTQSLMFNAADIMMTPDKPSARPSLIGWMPESMANSVDHAYEKYVSFVDGAIQQASDEMGLTSTRMDNINTPLIDGHSLIIWSVQGEQYGCSGENCIVAYNIQQPSHWKTPAYVEGGKESSFNIVANHPEKYSRLIFRQYGNQKSFPTDNFYKAVSEALPSWMIMYYPANTVVQDGELIQYPMLYENGAQLMFKDPQS